MKRIIGIIFIFLMCLVTSVNAEELTCSYHEKAELNSLASDISSNYEFKTDEYGNTYFQINIYNLSEKLSAHIETKDLLDFVPIDITYQDTNNGFYSFNIEDINLVAKFNITIKANDGVCTHSVRTISVVKPKYNEYSSYSNCKIEGMEDYIYCKEWITNKFNLSKEKILNSIQKKVDEINNSDSEVCFNCKVRDDSINDEANLKEKKKKTIITLVGLSIVDIIFIIIFIIKLRKDYVFE